MPQTDRSVERWNSKSSKTGLRKTLGAFRSSPVKQMQHDIQILQADIWIEKTHNQFAIEAIQVVSPSNIM